MPTICNPPTHLSTQAVGVALLHQFARERFQEENLTNSLHFIEDAEQELGSEICSLFLDSRDDDRSRPRAQMDDECHEPSNDSKVVDDDHLNVSQQSSANQSSCVHNVSTTTTIGSRSNDNLSVGPLNSTVKLHDASTDDPTFHSVALSNDNDNSARSTNTSTAGSNATITNDSRQQAHRNAELTTQGDSIYHSMNTTSHRINRSENSPNVTTTSSRASANRSGKPNLPSRPDLDKYLDKALGEKLRKLADDFKKSRERQEVKKHASKVDLQSISKEGFFGLLDGLFGGEVTSDRIVVLFFFCVDVAVRACSQAENMVVDLLKWSFWFIINIVCKKVEEYGGWEKVLTDYVPFYLGIGMGVTVLGLILSFLFNRRK